MPSKLARQLLGEFTGVGSMGTVEAPVATAVPSSVSRQRLARLRKRRKDKPIGEKQDPLIPQDAEDLDIDTGENIDDGGDDDDGDETNRSATTEEPLLEPALALVAPDCTPDGGKPLSPKQVPAATSEPPPVASAPAVPSPVVAVPGLAAPKGNAPENKGADVLSLFADSRPRPPGSNPITESAVITSIPGITADASLHAPQPPPTSGSTAAVQMGRRINFS